jgi:hypothetical protein
VKNAAQSVSRLDSHPDESDMGDVDVITRGRDDGPAHEVVAEEARKGYDLLVIGIEPTHSPGGGFTEEVTQIANSYAGPIAILLSRRRKLMPFERILVPINGSEASCRAAEGQFQHKLRRHPLCRQPISRGRPTPPRARWLDNPPL